MTAAQAAQAARQALNSFNATHKDARQAWVLENQKARQTGQPLPPEPVPGLLAQEKALQEAVDQLEAKAGRELADAQDVGPVVVAQDENSVTIQLPRDVLDRLLVCHEAGLSDDEHARIAFGEHNHNGSDGEARLLKAIFLIEAAIAK